MSEGTKEDHVLQLRKRDKNSGAESWGCIACTHFRLYTLDPLEGEVLIHGDKDAVHVFDATEEITLPDLMWLASANSHA